MHCSLPRQNGTRTIIRPMQNTQNTHTVSPCALAQRQVEVISSKQANKLLAQGYQSFMLLVCTCHHNLHDVQAATAAIAHTGKANPQNYAAAVMMLVMVSLLGRLHALIDEYKEVLVEELPPGLPPDRQVPHTIPTEPGQAPPDQCIG